MDKATLEERRAQAESEFSALDNEKQQITSRLNDIENRQYELRGQYQLLSEQLGQVETKAVSPSPEVIDVDAAVKESKKK